MTDRFELLTELGAGGMGSVWKARDTETGEIVALKLVHAHLARDPDYVARFEREVEIARRIDSPHVVKVLGYGTRDGIPYMAMEYVEGQSLRDVLRERGKLTWDEAKPIVRDVAEGLAAAHAAGVIHRDVKPSNILLTPDGRAKLADFGIARALDMTRLTGSSTTLGTPHYMAPDREVTPQSDLYSLGCVLFELLTGRPPFDGETPQEVWRAHDRERINVDALPREPGLVVAWLTRREPEQRPKSPHELALALRGGSALPRGGGRRSGRVITAVASGFAGLVVMGVGTALVLAGEGEQPPGERDSGQAPTPSETAGSTVLGPSPTPDDREGARPAPTTTAAPRVTPVTTTAAEPTVSPRSPFPSQADTATPWPTVSVPTVDPRPALVVFEAPWGADPVPGELLVCFTGVPEGAEFDMTVQKTWPTVGSLDSFRYVAAGYVTCAILITNAADTPNVEVEVTVSRNGELLTAQTLRYLTYLSDWTPDAQ